MKVIANYLPQYHVIPENSLWWGEGYTDWVGVKNSKPLFPNHNQPRVPLGKAYYSLDNPDTIAWQAKLARRYGVHAFGIYHYWFNSELHLLHKPAELLLENKDIDIGFMFLWDNGSWKRTWSNIKEGIDWLPGYDSGEEHIGDGVLARLDYGTKNDWKRHFEYLLPFFRDSRYVTQDGYPLFGFMQPRNDFDTIREMTRYWDTLAKENGLPGVRCISNDTYSAKLSRSQLEHRFRYAPFQASSFLQWMRYKSKDPVNSKQESPAFYDYDTEWKMILNSAKRTSQSTLLCGFVGFDDTPRRGSNARIVQGGSPEKFERYMGELLRLSKNQGKEHVFLTAWNEWGEGMYLEPDETNGYAYLDALKSAIDGLGVG